ncbi:hypothetical protein J0S82_004170 [Galemys pyrenaicus]|uniref:Ig-like domain-containing protein n=1 Tax=Galemys pyrenaicus TaxID=202257 RepID=A0A8J6DSF4_GALPY|nr:hypothetical protein J0S82_004170 [Galemys pyrenaicus]
MSFPPLGSSSLSCLGPGSSSPRSPWPASGLGPDSSPRVAFLPPLLSDQAQHVRALGTFHLFCQATVTTVRSRNNRQGWERWTASWSSSSKPGPADIHVIWEKNGREPEMCVPAQTLGLPDGRAHVLSWLRDTIRESTDYRCSVLSSAGSQASTVRVSVLRHEMTQQEKWTRELAAWRAMVGEHDRMLQDWRKAWMPNSAPALGGQQAAPAMTSRSCGTWVPNEADSGLDTAQSISPENTHLAQTMLDWEADFL